jgi:phosphoribosylformimino-5-aminoimidazole carboxamide ribotide isomerase
LPEAGTVILIPAIDIRGGKAVRLRQGDYSEETVYDDDPLDAARRWVGQGAELLHVVDLDGAREGQPVNVGHLSRIVEETGARVEYGGGLRDLEAIRAVLAAGAERAVVGTRALTDTEFAGDAVRTHGDRVVVSVDARAGQVATSGWEESSGEEAGAAVRRLRESGVEELIYTCVDRDGMLNGPDLDEVRAISEAVGEGRFIYSGGIGSLEHLRTLTCLAPGNLTGVIAGKALYEGRFDLSQGRRVLARD